jgi:hypothetical protein
VANVQTNLPTFVTFHRPNQEEILRSLLEKNSTKSEPLQASLAIVSPKKVIEMLKREAGMLDENKTPDLIYSMSKGEDVPIFKAPGGPPRDITNLDAN